MFANQWMWVVNKKPLKMVKNDKIKSKWFKIKNQIENRNKYSKTEIMRYRRNL